MDPQFSRSQNQSNEKLWRQQCGVKMVVQSDLRNGHLNLIPKSFVVRSVSSLFSNCMFVRFLFATVARTQFAIGLRCIALSAPLLLSRSGSKEDEFDQILVDHISIFNPGLNEMILLWEMNLIRCRQKPCEGLVSCLLCNSNIMLPYHD